MEGPVRTRTGKVLFASAILGLFVYSVVLNIGVLQRDAELLSDSSPFLQVVDLLNGKYHGTVAPFRVLYPVYPYVAWAVGKFVNDGLMAARLAALIPVLACPVLVVFACRMLGCSRRPSWMAGFLVASWPPLIDMARAPSYDSTFVCMTAAALTCILAALRSRSLLAFVGAGLACGIAAATRGPGMFFPVALIVPLWFDGDSATRELAFGRKILLAGVGILSFAVALEAARFPAARVASSLPPDDQECLKQVIADGVLFSEGTRGTVVYTLSSNCAEFDNPTLRTCALSWPQFTSAYGSRWIKMALKNWRALLLRDLVGVLTPFLVCFIPLALAFYQRWKNRTPGAREFYAIALIALPFLLIVPAIQLQDHYLLALIVVVCVLAGCGFEFARRTLGRRAYTMLATGCLSLSALAGVSKARQNTFPDPVWANYRIASSWIVKSPDYGESVNVMARSWGLYPFFGKSIIGMPVDTLDRLLCNAKEHHARFIIAGPAERAHNPHLVPDPRFSELKVARTFGEGSDAVEVFQIQD